MPHAVRPKSAAARAPVPVAVTADLCLLRRHSTLKDRSGSVSVGSLGPGAHKVLFKPSEHLWQVWGLILNVILPLLLSCWGFSFALGHGVSFLLGSNILMSMVVQQLVAFLEFSQEKMSARPSTLTSCSF